MGEDRELEDVDAAFETAIRRTADAQAHVDEVVDEGLVPPTPVVDDVVRRAEDVRDLAVELDAPVAGAPSLDAADEDRGASAARDG